MMSMSPRLNRRSLADVPTLEVVSLKDAQLERWVETGVLHRMWGALVEGCEELDGVDWEWQSADGAMGKARFGGT